MQPLHPSITSKGFFKTPKSNFVLSPRNALKHTTNLLVYRLQQIFLCRCYITLTLIIYSAAMWNASSGNT